MSSNRTVIKRLIEFERQLPQQEGKWHRLIVEEGEDADAQIADLIASGKAKKGDKFIIRRIVSPKHKD